MSAPPAATRWSTAALLLILSVTAVAHHTANAGESLPADTSKYVAVEPLRLADTRVGEGAYGFTTVDANTVRVDIAHRPGVPGDASAAVVNLTVVDTTGPNFVVAFPTGTRVPASSNVNTDSPGQIVANLVHVKVGDGGSIDIRMLHPVDIVVDLVGVYVPVAGAVAAGRLVTLPGGAQRVIDTRQRGIPVAPRATTTVNLAVAGVPIDAAAAVVTITAVDAQPGYWTAHSTGRTRPGVSTMNIDAPGQTRAAQAIVTLHDGIRSIAVFSTNTGHLIVDVVGWFTGPSAPLDTAGLFVPAPPQRMLDTRISRTLAPWAQSTYEVPTGSPFANVSAVAMNITALEAWSPGFVTAYPAGVQRPGSSNLNLPNWQHVVAAHAIVAVSSRGVALYTNAGAHLIADVAGWYLGTPATPTQAPLDSPDHAPNVVAAVHLPSLGVFAAARNGPDANAIVDQGFAAVTGTLSQLAAPGNVMLFAHRTTGAAPFRRIDQLKPGNSFSLIGSDGRTYYYVVVRTSVTSPSPEAIAAQAIGAGPVTAQLVACSKANGAATSLKYRIVVTGRLVGIG